MTMDPKRFRLTPAPSWFQNGHLHHITVTKNMCRALGLKKNDSQSFRLFVDNKHIASGAIQEKTGNLTAVSAILKKLRLSLSEIKKGVSVDAWIVTNSANQQEIHLARHERYWWASSDIERYWVEIRRLPGIGIELRCPLVDKAGKRNPWYELVDAVKPSDVVYHWNATEHRFVGRSVVSSGLNVIENERQVTLSDFTPIRADVGLGTTSSLNTQMHDIRQYLEKKYQGDQLYLPFQFREDGIRMMSNYFAKFPIALVELLFGKDGLAESDSSPPARPIEEGAREKLPSMGIRRSFLSPFEPKKDTDYLVKVLGGSFHRSRDHETLVNEFAAFLCVKGLSPACNAAVDIGIENPSVIIEAKLVGERWATSIREAIGQLYEYKYFQIVDPKSGLIFLSSKPVPDMWQNYLEKDRGVGVAWRIPNGFHLSRKTCGILGLTLDSPSAG